MRSKITLFLSSAVILSGLSLPAFADKGHGLFERSDTDGDGFVSKVEFDAGRDGMFDRIDANKDGILTQEEMQAARDAWRAKMGKPANDNQAATHRQVATGPSDGGVIAAARCLRLAMALRDRLSTNKCWTSGSVTTAQRSGSPATNTATLWPCVNFPIRKLVVDT